MRQTGTFVCLLAWTGGLALGCGGSDVEIRGLREQLTTADDRAVQAEKRAAAAEVSDAGLRDTLFKEQQHAAAMKGEITSLQRQLQAARREADRFRELAGQSAELIDYRNKIERQRRVVFDRTINELPAYQRQEFRVLRGKAIAKTLTLAEYARLTDLLGGPLAAYIAPGMDDVRKEVVRRTAAQNPGMAAELRRMQTDAFIGEVPANISLPEPPAESGKTPSP